MSGEYMETKYKELLEKLLNDIDKLDAETPWQEIEPAWWLQMMDIRAKAQWQINHLNEKFKNELP